jgi:Ser/Thr protein kinase RdoA (MazF antagonist)
VRLSPSVIAEAFGLGVPTGPLTPVGSGPSGLHHLWRLSTTRGHFAVKALSLGQPSDLEPMERGPVRLELAAFATGVAMPRPCLVPGSGAGIATIARPGSQPVAVHVHEWVDASTPTAPASTWLAAELGGALAVIHRVGWAVSEGVGVDRWYRAAYGASSWQQLADQAEQAERGWAPRLRAAVPALAEVEALVVARSAEAAPLLVCHSDLVPGNVLVSTDGRPWILDWDDAGPWTAAEEVAAAVVSWSTGCGGEPDAQAGLALVEGYRRAGGTFKVGPPTVLAGSLSAVASWLRLNAIRSLSSAVDHRGQTQAEEELADALNQLEWRLARLDQWLELLR